MTGVASLAVELGPKQLEVAHELVPAATTIALLVNPTTPTIAETLTRELRTAARTFGLQLHVLHASTKRDLDTAFAALERLRAGALVISTDNFFNDQSQQLVALAVRHAVPTIYPFHEYAQAGGDEPPGSIVIIGFLPVYRRPTPGPTLGLAGRNRVGGTMGAQCDALARSACELVHTAGMAQAL